MTDPDLRFLDDRTIAELQPLAAIVQLDLRDRKFSEWDLRPPPHMPRDEHRPALYEAIVNTGRGKFRTYTRSYREMLADVGRRQIRLPKDLDRSAFETELIIVYTLLAMMRIQGTETQRENIADALDDTYGRDAQGLNECLVGAGGLAAAEAVGFPVYLGATTLLGAASSAAGVSLPFVVYATLTEAMSIALGPPGWLALAGIAVAKWGKGDHRRALMAVLEVARLRDLHMRARRDPSITF